MIAWGAIVLAVVAILAAFGAMGQASELERSAGLWKKALPNRPPHPFRNRAPHPSKRLEVRLAH